MSIHKFIKTHISIIEYTNLRYYKYRIHFKCAITCRQQHYLKRKRSRKKQPIQLDNVLDEFHMLKRNHAKKKTKIEKKIDIKTASNCCHHSMSNSMLNGLFSFEQLCTGLSRELPQLLYLQFLAIYGQYTEFGFLLACKIRRQKWSEFLFKINWKNPKCLMTMISKVVVFNEIVLCWV